MPGGAPENPPGTGEEAYVTCPLGGNMETRNSQEHEDAETAPE